MTQTNNLAISLLEQSQAQKEITINQAIVRIDSLLNTAAKSRSLATPASSPAQGDLYIVASSPTGDWAGQAGKITYFDAIWRFITPKAGFSIFVGDEGVFAIYDGANWLVAGLKNISATSYTISAIDNKSTLLFTSASAVSVSLPNNLPKNFSAKIIQGGAGQITFSPASGASLHNLNSYSKSAGQYGVCELLVTANSGGSAAEYLLFGDAGA